MLPNIHNMIKLSENNYQSRLDKETLIAKKKKEEDKQLKSFLKSISEKIEERAKKGYFDCDILFPKYSEILGTENNFKPLLLILEQYGYAVHMSDTSDYMDFVKQIKLHISWKLKY